MDSGGFVIVVVTPWLNISRAVNTPPYPQVWGFLVSSDFLDEDKPRVRCRRSVAGKS